MVGGFYLGRESGSGGSLVDLWPNLPSSVGSPTLPGWRGFPASSQGEEPVTSPTADRPQDGNPQAFGGFAFCLARHSAQTLAQKTDGTRQTTSLSCLLVTAAFHSS